MVFDRIGKLMKKIQDLTQKLGTESNEEINNQEKNNEKINDDNIKNDDGNTYIDNEKIINNNVSKKNKNINNESENIDNHIKNSNDRITRNEIDNVTKNHDKINADINIDCRISNEPLISKLATKLIFAENDLQLCCRIEKPYDECKKNKYHKSIDKEEKRMHRSFYRNKPAKENDTNKIVKPSTKNISTLGLLLEMEHISRIMKITQRTVAIMKMRKSQDRFNFPPLHYMLMDNLLYSSYVHGLRDRSVSNYLTSGTLNQISQMYYGKAHTDRFGIEINNQLQKFCSEIYNFTTSHESLVWPSLEENSIKYCQFDCSYCCYLSSNVTNYSKELFQNTDKSYMLTDNHDSSSSDESIKSSSKDFILKNSEINKKSIKTESSINQDLKSNNIQSNNFLFFMDHGNFENKINFDLLHKRCAELNRMSASSVKKNSNQITSHAKIQLEKKSIQTLNTTYKNDQIIKNNNIEVEEININGSIQTKYSQNIQKDNYSLQNGPSTFKFIEEKSFHLEKTLSRCFDENSPSDSLNGICILEKNTNNVHCSEKSHVNIFDNSINVCNEMHPFFENPIYTYIGCLLCSLKVNYILNTNSNLLTSNSSSSTAFPYFDDSKITDELRAWGHIVPANIRNLIYPTTFFESLKRTDEFENFISHAIVALEYSSNDETVSSENLGKKYTWEQVMYLVNLLIGPLTSGELSEKLLNDYLEPLKNLNQNRFYSIFSEIFLHDIVKLNKNIDNKYQNITNLQNSKNEKNIRNQFKSSEIDSNESLYKFSKSKIPSIKSNRLIDENSSIEKLDNLIDDDQNVDNYGRLFNNEIIEKLNKLIDDCFNHYLESLDGIINENKYASNAIFNTRFRKQIDFTELMTIIGCKNVLSLEDMQNRKNHTDNKIKNCLTSDDKPTNIDLNKSSKQPNNGKDHEKISNYLSKPVSRTVFHHYYNNLELEDDILRFVYSDNKLYDICRSVDFELRRMKIICFMNSLESSHQHLFRRSRAIDQRKFFENAEKLKKLCQISKVLSGEKGRCENFNDSSKPLSSILTNKSTVPEYIRRSVPLKKSFSLFTTSASTTPSFCGSKKLSLDSTPTTPVSKVSIFGKMTSFDFSPNLPLDPAQGVSSQSKKNSNFNQDMNAGSAQSESNIETPEDVCLVTKIHNMIKKANQPKSILRKANSAPYPTDSTATTNSARSSNLRIISTTTEENINSKNNVLTSMSDRSKNIQFETINYQRLNKMTSINVCSASESCQDTTVRQRNFLNSSTTGKPAKKKIKFADEVGQKLSSVKYFKEDNDQFSSQDSLNQFLQVAENFIHKDNDYEKARFGSLVISKPYKWLMLFEHSPPDSLKNDLNLMVKLTGGELRINYKYSRKLFRGEITVRNLHFQKYVFARITYHQWNSFTDEFATFSCHDPEANLDKFVFSFVLDKPYANEDGMVHFAVCMQTGGKEYWDNNEGSNYSIKCYLPEIDPPSEPDQK